MGTVFDTARYILSKTGCLSTMKLQKLCYYAQAWHLVWSDRELFGEDFEAWANGPVCRKLWEDTRGKFSVSENDLGHGNKNNLNSDEKSTIDSVLEYYGGHDAQWLSQLTHMEDPWKEARVGVPLGAPSDMIITKESMASYYGGL